MFGWFRRRRIEKLRATVKAAGYCPIHMTKMPTRRAVMYPFYTTVPFEYDEPYCQECEEAAMTARTAAEVRRLCEAEHALAELRKVKL